MRRGRGPPGVRRPIVPNPTLATLITTDRVRTKRVQGPGKDDQYLWLDGTGVAVWGRENGKDVFGRLACDTVDAVTIRNSLGAIKAPYSLRAPWLQGAEETDQ